MLPRPPPSLHFHFPFSLLPSLGLRHTEASAERERVFRATRIAVASTRSIGFELKINEKLQWENTTAIRAYYK